MIPGYIEVETDMATLRAELKSWAVEGRTMRTTCAVALATIALAAPFVARADNGATLSDRAVAEKFDLWDSAHAHALPDSARDLERIGTAEVSAPALSESKTDVFRGERTIRFVDTYTPRLIVGSSTVGTPHEPGTTHAPGTPPTVGYPPLRVVPVAATPYLAAPELSAGIAVTGFTLLLGGLAVLRGRRTRLDPM